MNMNILESVKSTMALQLDRLTHYLEMFLSSSAFIYSFFSLKSQTDAKLCLYALVL